MSETDDPNQRKDSAKRAQSARAQSARAAEHDEHENGDLAHAHGADAQGKRPELTKAEMVDEICAAVAGLSKIIGDARQELEAASDTSERAKAYRRIISTAGALRTVTYNLARIGYEAMNEERQ